MAAEVQHIPKVLYHWRAHAQSTSSDPASKPYTHDTGRRALEESRQPLGVGVPVRRELHENRPKVLLQPSSAVDEAAEPVLGLLEPLHVRAVPADLQRVEELRRRPLSPLGDRVRLRQVEERVVDLDAAEDGGVIGEPVLATEIIGIERAPPLRVVVPRAPDDEPCVLCVGNDPESLVLIRPCTS